MNLTETLREPEGKTLEFKRDLSSPERFLRTVVAFALLTLMGLPSKSVPPSEYFPPDTAISLYPEYTHIHPISHLYESVKIIPNFDNFIWPTFKGHTTETKMRRKKEFLTHPKQKPYLHDASTSRRNSREH